MSDQMWAQGETRGFLLEPMCSRLSSWVNIRLACKMDLLAEKRCPQELGHMSRSWWGSKSDHYKLKYK